MGWRQQLDGGVYLARRSAYFFLVALTSLGAMGLLSAAYGSGGFTALKLLLLVLYAILILWIAASFWSATLGFWVLLTRFDLFARRRRIAAADETRVLPVDGRTAVLMPIYSEDPDRVFAGIRAIARSLEKTGQAGHFDFFVLSDTRDVATWIREECEWYRLCSELDAHGRIFYRNRRDNSARKSGNVADFVQRWGGNYRYMIVLDADSIMAGDTLVKMVRLMEANADTALIQAPPLPVNKETLFARILQFAGTAYGPLFTAGASFWQLGDANFWGHNAIIRVAPFAAHCGLPHLPGREPFGGEILSHDFVEAALLRRAGWRCWLAYELNGSYEELPPTLIDFAKRDRRWCQGNLQHARLIAAKGWHPVSRLHFAMGVMSYLSSPLWMLFLLVTGVEGYIQSQDIPDYFFANHLGPVWPDSFTVEMKVVLIFTLAMLFLPKLLALLLIALNKAQRQAFGGVFRAGASAVLESVFSILVAPVLMLFQTKFVWAIVLRRTIGWPGQQRADHSTSFRDALSMHGVQTLLGIAAGVMSFLYLPDYFWWFVPVLSGALLGIPLSMLSSSVYLGRRARDWGLFVTPQERKRPEVLLDFDTALAAAANNTLAVDEALREPYVQALHVALLPPDTVLSRRQQHYRQGLMYKVMEEGLQALSTAEQRELFSRPESLRELHDWAWTASVR
ncbi:MAG: glucans biosynthesis glucosyltransferase MdoH [Halioglobus sp.]